MSSFVAQNRKIDSLLNVIKKAKLDTNKINVLNELANEYTEINEFIKAEEHCNDALFLSGKLKHQRGTAVTYFNLADVYYSQRIYQKAKDNIVKAIEHYKLLNLKRSLALSYNVLGNIEDELSNKGSAKKAYFETFSIGKQTEDKKLLATSSWNLARIFSAQVSDSTITMYELAKQYYLEINNKKQAGLCEYYIGNFYFLIRNFNKAEKHFTKAVREFIQISDQKNCGLSYMMLGSSLTELRAFDKAKLFLDSCYYYYQLVNYKSGIADYNYRLGNLSLAQGEYDSAISSFEKSYNLFKEIDNKIMCVHNLTRISETRTEIGDYIKAQEFGFKALKQSEEAKNKNLIMSCLLTIGNVFEKIHENKKALEYNQKGLMIGREINNRGSVSILLNNIGYNYEFLGQYDLALTNLFESLKLKREINLEQGTYITLINIGHVYEQMQELDSAEKYTAISYSVGTKYDQKKAIAYSASQLGRLYFKLKNIELAEKYATIALEAARKIKSPEFERDALETLYKNHQSRGDNEKAFKFYREYISIRDSLYNTDKNKDIIRIELNNEFQNKEFALKVELEKREAIQKANYERQEAINQIEKERVKNNLYILGKENELKQLALTKAELFIQQKQLQADQQEKQLEILHKDKLIKEADAKQKSEEISRQKFVRNVFIIGAILLLIFAFFVLRNLKQTKKVNKIIAQQKSNVELQKQLVDEKQKEIIESITYARHLQEAILPPFDFINKYLLRNFILYLPKDLVAGDFYWAEKVGDWFFIAAADSTGHGVPGAMVSVVCSNALNRSIKEFNLIDTGQILDKTRELVLETFEKSTRDVKDGMDISLLSINLVNKSIFWSGANNPLWYIQNEELREIKANKQPIGKTESPTSFTTHKIEYVENTSIYLFTDGFADQFGGPKGKKFKYKQFSDLILKHNKLSINEQSSLLKKVFLEWKGNLEQVDDVCVIGIKI